MKNNHILILATFIFLASNAFANLSNIPRNDYENKKKITNFGHPALFNAGFIVEGSYLPEIKYRDNMGAYKNGLGLGNFSIFLGFRRPNYSFISKADVFLGGFANTLRYNYIRDTNKKITKFIGIKSGLALTVRNVLYTELGLIRPANISFKNYYEKYRYNLSGTYIKSGLLIPIQNVDLIFGLNIFWLKDGQPQSYRLFSPSFSIRVNLSNNRNSTLEKKKNRHELSSYKPSSKPDSNQTEQKNQPPIQLPEERISVLSPLPNSSTENSGIEIHGIIKDEKGVRKIAIYVNDVQSGEIINVPKDPSGKYPVRYEFKKTVPLQNGKNLIRILYRNRLLENYDKKIEIRKK